MAGRMQIGAVLAAAGLLAGCSSIVNHRGYIADNLLAQSLQPGIDNQQSVERTLGRPSFTSRFGPPVWYYVGSNTRQAPFTRPSIYEHGVTAVSFDANGNVAAIERTGMEKIARIDPESDETPTLGRNRTFLEDLFGNIGAVSSGGAGNSGGSGS